MARFCPPARRTVKQATKVVTTLGSFPTLLASRQIVFMSHAINLIPLRRNIRDAVEL